MFVKFLSSTLSSILTSATSFGPIVGMLLASKNTSMQSGSQVASFSSLNPSSALSEAAQRKKSDGGVRIPQSASMGNVKSPANSMIHHYVSPSPPAMMNYRCDPETMGAGFHGTSGCTLMPTVSEHLVKRERSDLDIFARQIPVEQQSASKKTRSNIYIPPRQIPISFTSQVGSLAVGSTRSNDLNQVGFRRQLSSSKIECFLGDHDAMDVDMETTRQRSMSF